MELTSLSRRTQRRVNYITMMSPVEEMREDKNDLQSTLSSTNSSEEEGRGEWEIPVGTGDGDSNERTQAVFIPPCFRDGGSTKTLHRVSELTSPLALVFSTFFSCTVPQSMK